MHVCVCGAASSYTSGSEKMAHKYHSFYGGNWQGDTANMIMYLDSFVLDRWHGETSISVYDEVLVGVIVENLCLLRIEAQRIGLKMAVGMEQAGHNARAAAPPKFAYSTFAAGLSRANDATRTSSLQNWLDNFVERNNFILQIKPI
jgi:hypothetical protein